MMYTEKQLNNGRRKLYRAEQWRRDNATAYAYAEGIALDHPETARYIEHRKTVFDVLIPAA